MASGIRHVTFDSRDPYTIGTFWAAVLESSLNPEDHPGDPAALVRANGVTLLFEQVPDEKVVKNRVHLDLQPADRTREEEVERLLGLGAAVVNDRRQPDGTGWVVMSDPEGNEFCVERSAAERTAENWDDNLCGVALASVYISRPTRPQG